MENKGIFQYVVIGLFIAGGALALLVLARHKGSGGGTASLTVWGPISTETFQAATSPFTNNLLKPYRLTYKAIPADDFDSVVVEAIASGKGPDLLILPDDRIAEYLDKVYIVPFDTYSERDFRDTYLSASEIYLASSGVIAFPMSIDPLVMYWNRSLFANAGIANPPRYWDEFPNLVKKLTVIDSSRNILKSAVPLGEYRNVDNAKDLFAALVMQAGGKMVRVDDRGGLVPAFADENANGIPTGDSALAFFTEYSNPVKSVYTWNRALPHSENAFLAGDLAIYFGHASEAYELQLKNPNLDFDVAPLPNVRGAGGQLTTASLYGVAILRSSRNVPAALAAAEILGGRDVVHSYDTVTQLPPVRRDLYGIAATSTPYARIFSDAALVSHSWLDPDPAETDLIFQNMVENVTSGRFSVSGAIKDAARNFGELK